MRFRAARGGLSRGFVGHFDNVVGLPVGLVKEILETEFSEQ